MLTNKIKYDVITKKETIVEVEFTPVEKTTDEKTTEIRSRRNFECFSIINRGNLWYQSLTEAQLVELSEWYQAWLNASETLVVPEKPSWL